MSLDERTHAWLQERFWRDDELLDAAREEFARVGPLIEVPNETGALLATLVRATAATRVLEVGTLFGYSTVWMARALGPDGSIDTLELEDAHADMAEQLFERAGLADRIHVHRGVAADTLTQLHGPYDIAFLDADKEGYVSYLHRAIELVRPGGLVIGDNMAQAGRTANPDANDASVAGIREFLRIVAEHPLLDSNVLPIGDGVSVSVRR